LIYIRIPLFSNQSYTNITKHDTPSGYTNKRFDRFVRIQ